MYVKGKNRPAYLLFLVAILEKRCFKVKTITKERHKVTSPKNELEFKMI